MKYALNGLNIISMALTILSSNLFAQEESKRALKTNYQEVYKQKNKQVDNVAEMFSEGEFYGRLRSNNFYTKNITSGLGGSLIYKSATLCSFSFTTGLYYSHGFLWGDNERVSDLKKAKDVLSRFDYYNTGSKSMSVLGQAYLYYSGIKDLDISFGRQLVETFYTKSNDSKMIPNVFDGIVVNTSLFAFNKIKLAYLYSQKLRDHTQSSSVLTYGDGGSTTSKKTQWSENDDSAMHKGLTYLVLKNAGKPTDSPLLIMDLKNRYFNSLNIDTSFYSVQELLSQGMLEANYKIDFDTFSITPGLRYVKQFDNGAGGVGGASYTGDSTGYKNRYSLEAQMIAARIVVKMNNIKINLGYSNVLDEADLITPWRGFPTSGYTRSMARYNWRANMKSYRLELVRNGNDKGVYTDLYTQASILYTNADEKKNAKDELYYYVGFVQNLPCLVDLQWRLRLGYTQYLNDESNIKNDLDTRFELNYLF